MKKYQVQYKNNSKTFTDTYYAVSDVQLIDLFQDLINAEITEIREVVYENPIYPKDDGNYQKGYKLHFQDEEGFKRTIKIPKVKNSIDINQLTQLAYDHLTMNGKKPLKITPYNL